MYEKKIDLENINPTDFFGINDLNIEKIRSFFPKVRIVARGNSIKAIGDTQEIENFEQKLRLLMEFYHKYNRLTSTDIDQLLSHKSNKIEEIELVDDSETIVYSVSGKPIKPKTLHQKQLVKEFNKNDLVFAIGPAGTGKTYVAIALALRYLRDHRVQRIILSRPAVEAGEKLGFLPGDFKEKLDPYLQALYDALYDMLPGQKLNMFMDERIIQIAPLAYMRGRTLSNAVVILDEAQNATKTQLKMFLTRMGENSKFIVTGDITQIDLPDKRQSGLRHAYDRLRNVDGISFVIFDQRDVVRHPLVKKIIALYDDEE